MILNVLGQVAVMKTETTVKTQRTMLKRILRMMVTNLDLILQMTKKTMMKTIRVLQIAGQIISFKSYTKPRSHFFTAGFFIKRASAISIIYNFGVIASDSNQYDLLNM